MVLVLITNSYAPYCYDISHVMGLPNNLIYRFRYRVKWITTLENISSIKEMNGIVVLRDFETGKLYPIRHVTIESVASIGEMNYIEFKLEEFFKKSISEKYVAQIEHKLKEDGICNVGGRELEKLVFEIHGDIAANEKQSTVDEQKEWEEVLGEIGNLDCYKDFSFLKFLHVVDSKGKIMAVSYDEFGKYYLTLDSGKLYYIDIIQHMPSGIEDGEAIRNPYNVELNSEKSEINILRGLQKVVGKYDLLRFIIKTGAGYSNRYTFMEIVNRQDQTVGKYEMTTLFLPTLIKPSLRSKRLRYLQGGLSIIALVLVIGATPLSSIMRDHFFAESEWIRTTGLLLMVFVSGKWWELITEVAKDVKAIRLS